ncbi:HTH_38 domain-containing protein [Trichonephila clavipes]|nr:HTH_38 domain-containing protein [Trichonephila clavipes]
MYSSGLQTFSTHGTPRTRKCFRGEPIEQESIFMEPYSMHTLRRISTLLKFVGHFNAFPPQESTAWMSKASLYKRVVSRFETEKIPLRRNRRQYEQLTDFDRGRIIGLREAGWSNRRIGRHLGRSDMVVARCWQQWITEGRVYRRGGSGRPRNTNDREDRAIRRVATSAPTTSLASIQRHLPPSRHPVPSRETIRRRLTEVGLRADVR